MAMSLGTADLLAVRRELMRFKHEHARAAEEFNQFKRGGNVPVDTVIFNIMAAVAVGVRYPVEEEADERYCAALDRLRVGRYRPELTQPSLELSTFRAVVDEAMDELAVLMHIVEKARAALDVLDALGAPLPATWSNLGAPHLARAINAHCNMAFRGALIR